MRKRLVAASVATLVCLTFEVPAVADATASPGKSAAYTSVSAVSMTFGFVPAAAVRILKGRKRRVLEVDVTVVDVSSTAGFLAVELTANGILMEPAANLPLATLGCGPFTGHCTLTANFWLDLDLAEAANPGQFIGVPIDVLPNISANPTTSGNVSVRARLVKK